MLDYNYIDESLENELNNLELPEELNIKIDKDYELNFSEDDQDFFKPSNFDKNNNPKSTNSENYNKSKNLNKINSISNLKKSSNKNFSNHEKSLKNQNLDAEFDLYMKDLDKRIEDEISKEQIEKNQIDLNLDQKNINLNNISDKNKALSIINQDPSIRNAIDNKTLSIDDVVNYIDYYELFNFINKSKKLTIDQLNKISDLCETETFEETEEDIKDRILNTLKITDSILDKNKFSPKELVFLDDKIKISDEKKKEKRKKENEKEYLIKTHDLSQEYFLDEIIQITRDKHIEIDDVYEDINNKDNEEENFYMEKDENNSNIKFQDEKKFINKLNSQDVKNILENDKEFKFLEEIYLNENYKNNFKIKNINKLFLVDKDLEDLEIYKRGKVKNHNDYNEKVNPLHNVNLTADNHIEYPYYGEQDSLDYPEIVEDLYKKHGISYNRDSKSTKNINDKKVIIEKLEKLNQTAENLENNKKNLKKFIPPIKNKLNNINNTNTRIFPRQGIEGNITHISENENVNSLNNTNNILKESISSRLSKSYRSKFTNTNNSTISAQPLKHIDLFTNDNKMTNLIKVREQRKEYLKLKQGMKSTKRPELFAFSTKHILINEKEKDDYAKIFDILENSKKNNNIGNNTDFNEVDKSTDSSKKNSIRKKIEEAIVYSKNKY